MSAEVRPLDITAARRSRGSQSFQSHVSAAASTRSWVQSAQNNPPPPPQPLDLPPAISDLRTMIPDEDDYTNVHIPEDMPSNTNTLGLHVVNTDPKPKKRFVGGFVTNIRKAFRRKGPAQPVWRDAITEEGSGSHQTDNTLPRYISTPPTPQALEGPSMPAAQPLYIVANQGEIPEALASGAVRRRQQQKRRVMESVVPSPTEVPIDQTRESVRPESEWQQPGTSARPMPMPMPVPSGVGSPPILSPHPSQRQDPSLLSPHPSRHSRSVAPGHPGTSPEHPASIQAHPPLAADYRRMALSKQEGTSSGGDGSEPSFETELNPIHRFFSTLYDMPWISTERVSVDYFPGMKQGAWTWKWAKRASEAGGGRVRVQVPIRKPLRPWYTSKKGLNVVEGSRLDARDARGGYHTTGLLTPRDDPLDLLSSGESVGSPLSVFSFISRSTPRPARRTKHKHEQRRRSYVVFPAPENVYRNSAESSLPKRHNHRHHDRPRKHHRRSGHSSSSRSPRATPKAPKSGRTVSPVPTVTPAGFYLMPNPPPGSGQGSNGGSPAAPAPGQMPYMTPVYMQMLPPLAMSDASSSPGLAGRGAGYNFAPMAIPVPMPGQFP